MTEQLVQLKSKEDDSTNHVYPDGSEFRLVNRDDYATIYLSSHTGCGLGCRMCHLTENGQTRMHPLNSAQMRTRALEFVSKAKGRINFSFMARGDALANPNVDDLLVRDLLDSTAPTQRFSKVTVSTIFPAKAVGDDVCAFMLKRFCGFQPAIYWSLYSVDDEVRRVWLPQAADPEVIADGLSKLQAITGQEVVIHHPLIDGVNDSVLDAENIIFLLGSYGIHYRLNLVRYNPPYSDGPGEASERAYIDYQKTFEMEGGVRVNIQPRVGYDVYASCGMFVPPEPVPVPLLSTLEMAWIEAGCPDVMPEVTTHSYTPEAEQFKEYFPIGVPMCRCGKPCEKTFTECADCMLARAAGVDQFAGKGYPQDGCR